MIDEKRLGHIAFSYAPGKAILVGEHAVVYGALAIAMPIDCGVRVAVMRASDGKGPMIRGIGPFFMGDAYIDEKSPGPAVLKSALAYLREVFADAVKDIAIVVDGNLPPGRGLGSSAALSVALLRGIYRFHGQTVSESELDSHALALETIFHGRPSGIDHTVVMKGQVIAFRKKNETVELRTLKSARTLSFIICLVGSHEGTKNMVHELGLRQKRHERAYAAIFSGLNDIAFAIESCLKVGHVNSIGELMNIAHGYLNALQVSTPEIEKLVAIARDRGALGAKLTGAGGGGAIIALADGNEKELMKAFKAAGYQSFVTNLPATMNMLNEETKQC
jgi:hydroxymethylglutaryl-CoA reductase